MWLSVFVSGSAAIGLASAAGLNTSQVLGGWKCSHYHTRGKWGVRFHGLNAEALCTGCHFLEGGLKRADLNLSEFEIGVLTDLVNDTLLGKEIRKTKGKGEIAKHFREQLKVMQGKRAQGVRGRIDFEEWI